MKLLLSKVAFAAGILLVFCMFGFGAIGGGLGESVVPAPAPPPPAPYSWAGPYFGAHIGKAWGKQHDNQSEVITEPSDPTDPVCNPGDVLVGGVCVTPLTCLPGFILVGGVCVLDVGSILCNANETPDPLTGVCECNFGYVRDPSTFICVPEGIIPGDKFDIRGLLAGLHAGRNWQRSSFVYGVEGEVDATNIKGSTGFLYPGGVAGNLSWRSDWQASLRLRAGYAANRTLFYGTVGLALGHAELKGTSAGTTISDSNTHLGWALGAGVERAFNSHWIGRIEARYTDFADEDYDLGSLGNGIKSGWSQTSMTLGLSYKF